MVRERVRGSEDITSSTDPDFEIVNSGNFEDPEGAREKIMDRFNAGESILQPPESKATQLGASISDRLDEL